MYLTMLVYIHHVCVLTSSLADIPFRLRHVLLSFYKFGNTVFCVTMLFLLIIYIPIITIMYIGI